MTHWNNIFESRRTLELLSEEAKLLAAELRHLAHVDDLKSLETPVDY